MMKSSPKPKLQRNSWVQCTICNVYFCSEDIFNHSSDCGEHFENYKSIACVKNSELFAICLFAIEKQSTGAFIQNNVTFNELVQINPITMKLCDLGYLEPVLINGKYVFYCMPNKANPLQNVIFSEELKLDNCYNFEGLVNVKHLKPDMIKDADSCFFTIKNLTMNVDTNYLEKCLLFNKVNKYLHKNEAIKLNYLGNNLEISIVNLLSTNVSEIIDKNINHNSNNYSKTNLNKDLNVYSIETLNTSFESLNLEREQSNNLNHMNTQSLISFYKVIPNTKFILIHSTEKTAPKILLDNLGGLEKEKQTLKFIFNYHFKGYQKLPHSENVIPRNILIYGQPGCGKTSLIISLANDLNVQFVELSSHELASLQFEESDIERKNLLKVIKNKQSCIILLDNIDLLLFNKRYQEDNLLISEKITSFINQVNHQVSNVITIAITNKIEKVPEGFLQAGGGNFNYKFEISLPNKVQRLDILKKQLDFCKINHNLSEDDIKIIAFQAYGYSGADLHKVCNDVKQSKLLYKSDILESLVIKDDFINALHRIQPGVMNDIAIDTPEVKWSDIGGRDELKKILQQTVQLPISHPELFDRIKIKPPKGVLMYGPPGCSKTMLAKAIANECNLNFISIQGTELFGKWVGETEQAIKNLFRKARNAAPAIIFFDEIEAFAVQRGLSNGTSAGGVQDRAVQQLLTEIDGIDSLRDVFFIAATNRPDLMDKAFMRPGRFDRLIYVPLPDSKTRQKILEIRFVKTPIEDNVDILNLVQRTEKFTCAEVSHLVDEACYVALEENLATVKIDMQHFIKALVSITPGVSKQTLDFYETFNKTHCH